MNFQLIVSTVKPDCTDDVIDAAKAAGATGATIITAQGSGVHEAKTFFGLTLEAQSNVIMFLLADTCVDKVLEAISRAGEFEKPGTGIAFVIPVLRTVGLESQIERFEREAEEQAGGANDGEE